jgi:hypothetical protein
VALEERARAELHQSPVDAVVATRPVDVGEERDRIERLTGVGEGRGRRERDLGIGAGGGREPVRPQRGVGPAPAEARRPVTAINPPCQVVLDAAELSANGATPS